MSNTIFLVAYVTENNEVKSATIFTDVSYSGTLGPRAFEHYAQAVKVKTGDTVKYLLNIFPGLLIFTFMIFPLIVKHSDRRVQRILLKSY